MKFKITTKNPEVMREAFEKMKTEIAVKTKGSGVVNADFTEIDRNTFILELGYLFSNPLTNFVIQRELSATLKKMDRHVKIEKY